MTGGTLRSSSSVRVSAAIAATGAKASRTTTAQQTTAYGVGSGQANLIVSRSRTLAAGQAETIDLFSGATLLDLFDGLAPFGTIRYIEIAVTAGGDAAGLRIGGAASNPWGAFFADAGDMHLTFPTGPSYRGGSAAGAAVTAAAKNLKVHNLSGTASVTYDIVISGTAVALSGTVMGVLGLPYA